jgi:uncharacterized protein
VKNYLIPRNNDAEMKALEDVCTRLVGFDRDLGYERIDGFLTGLAAGPRLPEPQVWRQAMLGDTFERVFADPADQTRAMVALQARLHVLCKQLDPQALFEDPDALRLEPLMEEWSDEAVARVLAEGLPDVLVEMLLTGREWGVGFMLAQAAFEHLWAPPEDDQASEQFEAALSHIAVLTWPVTDVDYQQHLQKFYANAAPTRDELISQALWSVQDLRMHWVDFAPVTQTIRVDSKPGRNDPCPCGSGKKFKKCHGA